MKKFFSRIMKNVSRHEMLLILAFCFAFIFSNFVFNQADIFFHNQQDFGISVGEFWSVYIWSTILLAIVFFVILFLLCKYSKKVFTVCLVILFGLMIAEYLQVLFFNGNYLSVLGEESSKKISVFYEWFNFFLYVFIIFAPLALLLIKNKKLLPKILIGASIIIFTMQSIGVIPLGISVAANESFGKRYFFSYREQMKLSKNTDDNSNIIVFVMDRLDVSYADDVFTKWPDSKKIFNGFTYYRDNLSQYAQTFPSVPSLLTDADFTETQTQSNFLTNAWDKSELFEELHNKDYLIKLLPDLTATYTNATDMPYADNVTELAEDDSRINHFAVLTKMLQLSIFREAPFLIKKFFKVVDYQTLPNQFVTQKDGDKFNCYITSKGDLKFMEKLKEIKLKSHEDKKVFSFIHLYCSHDDAYNEDLVLKPKGTVSQTYGAFKILNEYFNQMRVLDMFNNSTIIVLADHGYSGYHAALLVKPSKGFSDSFLIENNIALSDESTLLIDNNSQMSNKNFNSTIMQIIGSSEKKSGLSYFDVIKNGGTQTRYVYNTSGKNWKGNMEAITTYNGKYTINGNSWNEDSWSYKAG